jgi:hypothetical protein
MVGRKKVNLRFWENIRCAVVGLTLVEFTVCSIFESAHIYATDFLTLKYYDLLAMAEHKIHPCHFPKSNRTLPHITLHCAAPDVFCHVGSGALSGHRWNYLTYPSCCRPLYEVPHYCSVSFRYIVQFLLGAFLNNSYHAFTQHCGLHCNGLHMITVLHNSKGIVSAAFRN